MLPNGSYPSGFDFILSNNFQRQVVIDTEKWDKEWMRYFSNKKDYSFYFYDMSTSNYALSVSREVIEQFDKSKMYSAKLFKNLPPCSVWADGNQLVGKTVLEMGCGPGLFGRIASRFVKQFIGIDISLFALSIARLTSPKICIYLHLSDIEGIKNILKSVDTCVSRHFFIHHNYKDSLWILQFLRDVTKDGGIICADFFSNQKSLDGDRRRRSIDPLHKEHASALYEFSNDDVNRIANDVGFEIIDINYEPEFERRFATFRVPVKSS
jgi:SAM-dependent methyltransferase